MNVLFACISAIPDAAGHSISLDLLHEFRRNGHEVYIACGLEKKEKRFCTISYPLMAQQ